MPTYTFKSISPDGDGLAHVQVEITTDDGETSLENLCGMDVTSAETLNASIMAYLATKVPPAQPEDALPADVAALLDQPQKVDTATLEKMAVAASMVTDG